MQGSGSRGIGRRLCGLLGAGVIGRSSGSTEGMTMDLDLYARLVVGTAAGRGSLTELAIEDIAGIVLEMDGPEWFRKSVLDDCARVLGVRGDE